MQKILLKNADIVTVNPDKEILLGYDLLIEGDKIVQIARNIDVLADITIDATGKAVLPGFVQTHTHLCQTLFRGMAENCTLLDWLRGKIWKFEAAHNEESTYYSALLGIGEMISGGTTTILDMGGVNHTNKIFEALAKSGMRAFAGKAMMDEGIEVPPAILEKTSNSLQESMELYEKWDGACDSRIKYAFAPRFILSCSDSLFKELAGLSTKYEIPVHTHALENKGEGEEIVNLRGAREFDYFEKSGILSPKFLAAHCVWANQQDLEKIKKYDVKVLHCPSSNFKLGSGMLNLKPLLDKGICVSIGADGAPCNNNLDMYQEIRTTALMQNVLNHPGAIEAYKYLELATIEGAKALGIDEQTGSLEVGKKADLQVVNLDELHTCSCENVDLPTKLVYSAKSSDVETVIIDGQLVLKDKTLLTIDKQEVISRSSALTAEILAKEQYLS